MSLKETIAELEHPMIMALGNPLLDILVQADDNNLFSKYNLAVDGQTELKEAEIGKLLEDLTDVEKIERAGGSALNTLRLLQKLCSRPDDFRMGIFYGGLGIDTRGLKLKELINKAGVDAKFALNFDVPTGTCICLVNSPHRSLVANIGAAAYYTVEDLNCVELPLDSVKIIYIEGFFITHSYDVAREVIKNAQGKNIIIAFNLSGTYIFKDHHTAMCQMVGQSKIVFGNVQEMMALADCLEVEYESPAEIPFLLNKLKSVSLNASSSNSEDWLESDVFVMTQGGNEPAIVVWGMEKSVRISPIKPRAPIVDTTGAGDSLVAGFLAGVLAGQDPKTCLKWGCKVASEVITQVGVTLPNDLPEDFLDNC